MPQNPTRILIADDHPLFRGALRQTLSVGTNPAEVFEAGDLNSAAANLAAHPEIDLILLDLNMPGVHGFSGLIYLRAQFSSIPVIVVSGSEERSVIRRCVDFGAAGFIPKTLDVDSMRKAISIVLEGGTWTPADVDLTSPMDKDTSDIIRRMASLTPQQVRVLMMLSEGLLNKQIAYELTVSEATVKAHVSAILTKLGVESRTQAVILASKIELDQGGTLNR